MIIVYYKNKTTGEFTRVHTMRDGASMDTLAPLIEKYNTEDYTETCGAVEVADDSLEAYLFKTRNQRANWDREAVQDAIDALDSARDYLRALEG